MVLQRRLINLRKKNVLVLAIGLHRIKMFGALGECGVEDGLVGRAGGIGIIPDAAVARAK